MRLALVASVLVVTGCGGASKPADAPSTDTSSLESSGSSASKESAEQATSDGSDAAAPAPSAKVETESAPEPTATPSHPTPAVTGSIDGKPFAPKLAHVAGKMQKDGRVTLSIDESTDCNASSDATLTMVVPWQDGYKVDLGSLKRGSKKSPGEIAFMRTGPNGKKEVIKAFKPSGRVTIIKAPTAENAMGKMKIDMQSGDYMLAGDLDVQVCVAPK